MTTAEPVEPRPPAGESLSDVGKVGHERWECGVWMIDEDTGRVLGKCPQHYGGVPKRPSVDEGVEQAIADADVAWLERATKAVRAAARAGGRFTSDDLREHHYCVPEPAHGSHWGALLMLMHRRGVIERIGDATSRRPAAAGRKISVWQGRGA